jgi:hypothetical protein
VQRLEQLCPLRTLSWERVAEVVLEQELVLTAPLKVLGVPLIVLTLPPRAASLAFQIPMVL